MIKRLEMELNSPVKDPWTRIISCEAERDKVSWGITNFHCIPHDGVVEVIFPSVSTPNDIEIVLNSERRYVSSIMFSFESVRNPDNLHRGGETDGVLQEDRLEH